MKIEQIIVVRYDTFIPSAYEIDSKINEVKHIHIALTALIALLNNPKVRK